MKNKGKGKYIKPKYQKLNIGCGYNKKKGFINIDKAKHVNPDKVVDIEKGLPFPEKAFEYIYSEHCLEHIEPQNWRFVLNEICRIAKNNCILELKLPFDNLGQRTNADHFRTFSWHSFDQFSEESKRGYYSNLKLKRLHKCPNKLVKLFYYLFPFLKYEVHLKFKVVKK
jgi:ubiquinone/menaquinone biosynthesis C-methylase UbiE